MTSQYTCPVHAESMLVAMEKLVICAQNSISPEHQVTEAIRQGLDRDTERVISRRVRIGTWTTKYDEGPFALDGIGLALSIAPEEVVQSHIDYKKMSLLGLLRPGTVSLSKEFKKAAQFPGTDPAPEKTIADTALEILARTVPRYQYEYDFNGYQVARRTFQATLLGLLATPPPQSRSIPSPKL